jgi:hypothetical protein
VSTPKNAGLSSRRIALLLKHLLENGQDLCQATIDETDCEALVEREALKLTIGAVKPVAHWPLRIAIFVHGGNVQARSFRSTASNTKSARLSDALVSRRPIALRSTSSTTRSPN